MSAVSEERALLIEAHNVMREIAAMFLTLQGGTVDYRDSSEMTDAELLLEMRDALTSARDEIGPALQHPAIKPMVRMLRR